MTKVLLRPFDGSLDMARGILAIDRATFNDCPYLPEQIVTLLTASDQRAWVAEVNGGVVGFVSAFPTYTMQAEGWEVDLLAVHPRHRRQGIGTALIKQAVGGASGSGAARARAVVALKNHASRRAFEVAGFQPLPETYHLMRCEVAGAAARTPVPGMEAIHPLASESDASGVLRLSPGLPRMASEVARLANMRANTLLIAKHEGCVSAFAELVQVQTLLYAGVWVEMLVASRQEEAALLVATAVERAKAEGGDEIGCLVTVRDWRLRQAFVGEGFTSEGKYLVMLRAL